MLGRPGVRVVVPWRQEASLCRPPTNLLCFLVCCRNNIRCVCRIGDESTRFSGFKPAAPGTKFAYQFVTNQTYGLYPQLANVTPFFLTPKVRGRL